MPGGTFRRCGTEEFMPAGRSGSTCRPCVCRLAAAALVALFIAGAGMARAQQPAGALAASVTLVRSAAIEIPATALRGVNPTADAAAAINIRYGLATRLPGPATPPPPTLPSAKDRAPVVSPPANGRALPFQF
jgi:hypothetical protein